MNHVLSTFSASDVKRDPFPHVVTESAINPEICDQLISEYPSVDIVSKGESPENNKRFSYSASDIRHDNSISDLWRKFIEAHLTTDFFKKFLELFESDVLRMYPDFEKRYGALKDFKVGVRGIDDFETVDVLLDAQICINTPVTDQSSVKIAHVDNTKKLFSGLFYLRPDNDTLDQAGDLELYKFKSNEYYFHGPRLIEEKYVEPVSEVAYQKNTIILFPDSINALHGVKEREETDIPRLFMNLVGEVKEDLYDLSPYYKKHFAQELNLSFNNMPPSTRQFSFKFVPKKMFLYKPEAFSAVPTIKKIFPYTQLNFGGLYQMLEHINDIDKNNVEGALVEMGCGRGGCSAFMADTTRRNGSDRDLWLFDSFEGLSEVKDEDLKGAEKKPEKIKEGYLKVSEDMPKEAMKAVGIEDLSKVHIVKGWFNESLPGVKSDIGKIAILRLDADLYEPTIYCLEEMFDQISIGGYVVIDDYKNWVGARRALYEFFYKNNLNPFLRMYPNGGVAYFKKTEEREGK